ncbi:MAG: hypothetical protein Q8O55_00175 [Dehalococcoidales bacterium]|nr:hypothetical protein [Dehalococcoidales bacterium]
MKTILTIIMITLIAMTVSCTAKSQDTPVPDYSGPTVTDSLMDGYQQTTIKEVESFIRSKLQVPTYLPPSYEIQEVYYKHHPESSPPVTSIYLLISDQPVEWKGTQFRCRLVVYIGWNKATLGLKMPWAEFIEEAGGRLEEKEDKYVLWKASYGEFLDSTVQVYASRDFSRDELIKVAASIPGYEKIEE